jgi:hypothetical protein
MQFTQVHFMLQCLAKFIKALREAPKSSGLLIPTRLALRGSVDVFAQRFIIYETFAFNLPTMPN